MSPPSGNADVEEYNGATTAEEAEEEVKPLRQRRPAGGPNSGNPASKTTLPPPPPGTLPPNHPVNIIQRILILGAALWGLWEMKVFPKVLRHPRVSHTWFKLGLAVSIAILLLKSYVELYEGKICRNVVEYHNYRQTTHLTLALLILATISFHAALWSAFGGFQTILIMLMLGYGVLLQLMLLVHNTWVQNLGGVILMTLFLQQYQ